MTESPYKPRHAFQPGDAWVCAVCIEGNCLFCVDEHKCHCKSKWHTDNEGEPINQQILDPETGDVWAPGLVVHQDGRVTFFSRSIRD